MVWGWRGVRWAAGDALWLPSCTLFVAVTYSYYLCHTMPCSCTGPTCGTGVKTHTHTHTCTGLLTAGRWRTFFLIFFSFRAFFFRLYIFSKCAFVAERNNVIRLIVGVSQYLWCYYCSWLSFNTRKMGFLTVDVCVHACVRVCVCVWTCERVSERANKKEKDSAQKEERFKITLTWLFCFQNPSIVSTRYPSSPRPQEDLTSLPVSPSHADVRSN